jgi:hypothetical protein
MNKKDLKEFIDGVVAESVHRDHDYNSYYKPKKKPHYQKYRRSKRHPEEIDNNKLKAHGFQKQGDFDIRQPGYEIPPNVRAFLNSTLGAIPDSPTADRILDGVPVSKREAMDLSKHLISIPYFPYKQPRKLMSLLILLSIENAKG